MGADNINIISGADLQFLRENAAEIINDPILWSSTWEEAGLGLAYAGLKKIPLGILLEQWSEGKMTSSCVACGESVFIFFASGSPLSGTNQWKGRCVACNTDQFGRWESFGAVLQAVLPRLEDRPALGINPLSVLQLLAKLRAKTATQVPAKATE